MIRSAAIFFAAILIVAPLVVSAGEVYNPGPQITAPSVLTGETSVSGLEASVSLRVTPNRGATQAWVEYGPTAALGRTSGSVDIAAGSQSTVSIKLSELSPNTKYYYRGAVRNLAGTGYGEVLSFTTGGEIVTGGGERPLVQSGSVVEIDARHAVLRSAANSRGYATQVWFEYGLDESLGERSAKQSIGSSSAWKSFEADIALEKNTEYYYRAVAESAKGIARGRTQKMVSAGDAAFTVEPATALVSPGRTVQFRAFYDMDGSGESPRTEVTDRVFWLSSNTEIAAHQGEGRFAGRTAGAVTVAALYNPERQVENVDDLDNLRAEAGLSVPGNAIPSGPAGPQGGGEVVTLDGGGAGPPAAPEESAGAGRILLAALAILVPIALVCGGGYFILKKLRG